MSVQPLSLSLSHSFLYLELNNDVKSVFSLSLCLVLEKILGKGKEKKIVLNELFYCIDFVFRVFCLF